MGQQVAQLCDRFMMMMTMTTIESTVQTDLHTL